MKNKNILPKKVKLLKNKIIKKENKTDLKSFIILECQKYKNIILMDINKEFAFIIKKKTETIRREHNSGTMNPVEYNQDVNFFHAFMIRFKTGKKLIDEPILEILEEKEFPIYIAESEYDIVRIVEKA